MRLTHTRPQRQSPRLVRPPRQQPVAERPAERIARAEPAQHLDRRRLEHPLGLRAREQHAVAAELDDRELDSLCPKPRRGLARIVGADRDRALLAVADRDRRVLDGVADPRGRLLARASERRSVVEIEHGVADVRGPAAFPRPSARSAHGTARSPSPTESPHRRPSPGPRRPASAGSPGPAGRAGRAAAGPRADRAPRTPAA